MHFVIDECCDACVARALSAAGHQVTYIAEISNAISDSEVLATGVRMGAIVVTEDKGFGDLVFVKNQASTGVILVRWPVNDRDDLGDAVVNAVAQLGPRISGRFVVITPEQVRVR